MIEDALTEAVKKAITDNRNAIPGYDLCQIFGI